MAEDKNKPKKSGGFKLIFFMVLVGCMVPFGVPTLLVCSGLFPTLIALVIDRDENRAGFATIAYMNFAGVLPFILDLWMNGQTMDVALRIVRDPFTWVVMLGSAGVGQLILFAIPPAIAGMVINKKANRLVKLREGIKQLETIWGPDVATATPIEALRRKD